MTSDLTVRALLVEDSDEDARLVERTLSRCVRPRFDLERVDRLGAGERCLGDDVGFDIVLLDFSLPDGHGLETLRRIQRVRPDLPVIVLTSLEDDEVASRAVAEGAQDWLVKRDLEPRLLTRSVRYAIERNRSDRALRDSEERYRLAVRGANDGLWDWDLDGDAVYLSPRWKAMLGYTDDEIGTRPVEWFDLVHPDDRSALRSALQAHFSGEASHFEMEHRMRHRSGDDRWVLTRGVAVRDASGRAVRMAGSLTDVTARKRAEQQLLYDAFHDGLTGLANRALFIDRLAMAIAASRRRHSLGFAVLFLDLDRFKTINDSLGHSVGDRLLVSIGDRLQQIVRPGDTVARLGGDEFAILIAEVRDAGGAVHVAERALEEIARSFSIDGHEVFVTTSVGIALGGVDDTSPEAVLRDADIAMYRAKAAGKARYEVFNAEMHANAVRLMKLETDLRVAIEQRQFVVHYQPIVDLRLGSVAGFEALVRWDHPERGLVAPGHFIGIAEETGLIVPLGWWVLEQACTQTREWQDRNPSQPPLWISVNVSGKLFHQPDAVETVLAVLERTGLPPESLRLEVTESVVLDHGDQAVAKLHELRAMGVQLSVDDFGTGYSSLSYLQRFRYDSLKIDRSFVSRMGSARGSRTIVETILQLAHDLGIGVVAEGVETEEQARRLRELDCPHGQGYWFARPLNIYGVDDLLASDPSW
jgi:diguanylate cyclase (GGDEF)-like protein/PAS domain S-box-containing protein